MNNALTPIMGEASLLGEHSSEERERILEATAYTAQLTGQLMVFSRRGISQPQPLDRTATIRGMLKPIRRVIPSEIELVSDLPNETVVVMADPTPLLQILLNLAGNAINAMGNTGTLTITLRSNEAEGQAILEVTDTGPGIALDVIPKISEPFFTTKPAGQGTGLGLANVKQLVEVLHGAIGVRSELGQGATFSITLPTTRAAVETKIAPGPNPSQKSGTILVVDDDVRVRAIAYTALERLGYRVLEAASPDAVRNVLHEHADHFDLVLTDVVMGGGGGAVVIEMVKRRLPQVRVLVMSGYNDDETLRRGIAQGAYPFISKPFTADALAQAVERALSN